MFNALLVSLAMLHPGSTVLAPKPLLAVPSPRQLAWQSMDCYAFAHFGPNTFTDVEWGKGTEDPNLFDPKHLDCMQWVRTLKAAGMKGVIITAKHHDGFCLWPSKYSTHTVAQSKWENGKGDVLRDLSRACKAEGMKMGVYLSPWDRNHPAYGTPAYNDVFVHMLTEVLTHYGPIFEVWFDGANGEGPNGKKQTYDWPRFIATVRKLQPNAVIFSDAGPDVRWVGNEAGQASETNWSTLDRDQFYPGIPDKNRDLGEGDAEGKNWLPAECDVSIRPGWFYHPEEDSKVKSAAQLEDLYYASVGRNSHLLLNVPPDRDGRIAAPDVAALKAFHANIAATFKNDLAEGASASASDVRGDSPEFAAANVLSGDPDKYWATDDGAETATLTLKLAKPALFDRVTLQEPIQLGQRISAFTVEARDADGAWTPLAVGTTVGAKRILRVQPTTADAVRVEIEGARACPALASVGLFASPDVKKDWDPLSETPAQKAARMQWFEKARFGMFIHWGLYSEAGGEWNGKDVPGAGEWLLNDAKIKPTDYEALLPTFNPYKFDATKWVRIAKDAGMKYIVITSKHHEGFAMWPSKMGPWNIGNSAFHRDPLMELSKACKAAGIRLCFYHSIMDWHNPLYLPRRAWDDRPTTDADFDKYVEYLKGQLKELLTNYGPIGILWFDGQWEGTWNHDRGIDLYRYVRKLQPNIIVNNRVDSGNKGPSGTAIGPVGDYGTPEQTIPANGLPGQYWETCMTMNDTWGFHKTDNDWKSPETLIRNLVDIASKGGNYLLNVGPTGLGEIPEPSIERLEAMGKWTHANGEALYDTEASPFPKKLAWGRVTQRPGKLYLHVFDQTQPLVLTGLRNRVVRAYLLTDPKVVFPVVSGPDGPTVQVDRPLPDNIDTVIVAEIEGAPEIVVPAAALARPDAHGVLALGAQDGDVHGDHLAYEEPNKALGFWTEASDSVSWSFALSRPGEFEVVLDLACEPATAGGTFEVTVGGRRLTGTVPATADWHAFTKLDLGTVQLVSSGEHTLSVKPIKLAGYALMNLRSVTLVKR